MDGTEEGAARTYFELGRVELNNNNLDEARNWYSRSLSISEKEGDRYGVSINYHQLGLIAQLEKDHIAARDLYIKSLSISEELEHMPFVAANCRQLGVMAMRDKQYIEGAEWLIKCVQTCIELNNTKGAKDNELILLISMNHASPDEQQILMKMWGEANFPSLAVSDSGVIGYANM